MIVRIHQSRIAGMVEAPASKSAMQRALALAFLHPGDTWIYKPGKSKDDQAAIGIIRSLGAELIYKEGIVQVKSTGLIDGSGVIHAGESGLAARMFIPILALSDQEWRVEGSGSLLNRPMDFFQKIFPALHVQCQFRNGFLPAVLNGPLEPVDIQVDAGGSSQYLTGLLFAFGKAAQKRVTIHVSHLVSKPYIHMSLAMMRQFGYQVEVPEEDVFVIHPYQPNKGKIEITIEGDWSGASFILVAAALSGNGVQVKGLQRNSLQADRAICDVLESAGAHLEWNEDVLTVQPSTAIHAFTYDATQSPDLFPPLAALATGCAGISVIKGIHRLAHKESDRVKSLLDVFQQMGSDITVEEDSLVIKGGVPLRGARLHAHGDHRIAMAVTIAALGARGPVWLEAAESVGKSYPDFFADMRKLGANIIDHQ